MGCIRSCSPESFANNFIFLIKAISLSTLETKTASSFPRVVVVAGCPWVKDNKDKDFVFLKEPLTLLERPLQRDHYIFNSTCVIKEYEMLLMSRM